MSRGVADGHRTYHLSMAEGVDLASVSGDARADEGIWGDAWKIPMDRGAWQATTHGTAKSWT